MKRARQIGVGSDPVPKGSGGGTHRQQKQKAQVIGKAPKFDAVTKAHLDEDEAKLEALVFGGGITKAASSSSSSSGAAAPASQRTARPGKKGGVGSGVAWEDEDDREISIDIAATSRLRKLRQAEDEFEVSGREYQQRLRERHQEVFMSRVKASTATSAAATLLGGDAASGDVDGWATLPSTKRRRKNEEKKERKAKASGGKGKQAWGDDDESDGSSSDSSGDSDSSDDDSFAPEGDDDDDDEADEEALLRGATSVLASKKTGASSGPLPPGTISVTRVRDANRSEPSKAVVQAVQFHHGKGSGAEGSVVFTAGLDHKLRFFAVDGKKNPKVASVFFPDLPITAAAWAHDGSEVICSGRRPFFYTYDVGAGSAVKIPRILGRDEKSLESMVVQQPAACRGSGSTSSSSMAVSGGADCPPLISFLGQDGTVILVSQRTKAWVSNLKMNGTVRAACFTKPWLSSPGSSTGWSDLLTVGGEGEVYRWDLRMMGKCLYRHQDEGLSSGTALAATEDGRCYAVGSASGVVNVYDCASSDIQRRYTTWGQHRAASTAAAVDDDGLMGPVTAALAGAGGGGMAAPRPAYTSMALTTAISHLSFSAGKGEILSIGSQKITDSFRLIHTGSGKPFGNWPTSGTPLHYVTCSAFSPNSGYIAIGNDRGRVLLYRLNHYLEA